MKKIIAIILTLNLLLPAAISVSAEAGGTGLTKEASAPSSVISDQNRLAQILVAVKSLINIPQEYSEFEYHINTRYEKENWFLNWHDPERIKSISIATDADGNIQSYSKNDNSKSHSGAPTILKDDALNTAKDFIAKVNPEIIGKIKLVDDRTSSYFYNNTYQFTFQRIENDIPHENSMVNVSVNYTTGEVSSFDIEWNKDISFQNPDGKIDVENASKKWQGDTNMELQYRIFAKYNDETDLYDNVTAKLVYGNKDSDFPLQINALTGEYITEIYSWDDKKNYEGVSESNDTAAPSGAGESKVELSESEQKRISELEGYISAESADKIVRSYNQLSIDDTYTLSSSSMKYDYFAPYATSSEKDVIWSLRYTQKVVKGDFKPASAYAIVNAKTGELVRYSSYNNHDYFDKNGNFVKPELKIDDAAAKKLVDDFVKVAKKDKYKDLSFADISHHDSFEYIAKNYGKDDKSFDGEYYTNLYVTYNRQHNGINVYGEQLNAIVDCITGKITSLSTNWSENTVFEDKTPKIDQNQALETYFSNAEIWLTYIPYTVYLYDEKAENVDSTTTQKVDYPHENLIQTREETLLAYTLTTPFYVISAITGKPIDFDGNDYKKVDSSDSFKGYNDISGHWGEKTIRLLSDIGLLLEEDSFRPDDIITQKEFMAILLAASRGYNEIRHFSDIDMCMGSMIKDMRNNSYYIAEKDSSIEPDAPLMRKDAAKFIMRALDYEEIATLPGIYKTDFIDNNSIDPDYIGYTALAKALGIINGSNGRFNGDENITKAESAALIYNYLNVK